MNTINSSKPLHITAWMSISDSQIEQSFQLERLAKWRTPSLMIALVLCLLNLLGFYLDTFYGKDSASLTYLIVDRFMLFLSSLWLVVVLVRHQQLDLRVLLFLEVFVVTYLFFASLLIFGRESLGFVEPVSQIVVIFILYLLTPFSWRKQIIYATLWSLGGMMGWYAKIGLEWSFFSIFMWQFFAHIAGALTSRSLHFFARSAYLQNITLLDQVKTEQNLRAQLSDLIDLLTHELRNPLANIEAQARLIERTNQQLATKDMARKIISSTRLSADIISAWVDKAWQGQSSDSSEACNQQVIPLLHQVQDSICVRYPKFAISIEEKVLPTVEIEPKILRLVFSNILENAAKYAPSERPMRVHFRERIGKLIIRFRDYGQGISVDDQLLIFSKYYRANPQEQTGYGVGLYLVREMLEQCQASIRVQSREGFGTAFVVELPISSSGSS